MTARNAETLAQRAERLAAALEFVLLGQSITIGDCQSAAETLRALAAANAQLERERDEARDWGDALMDGDGNPMTRKDCAEWVRHAEARVDKAEAERDAAVAARDRLRDVARDLCALIAALTPEAPRDE